MAVDVGLEVTVLVAVDVGLTIVLVAVDVGVVSVFVVVVTPAPEDDVVFCLFANSTKLVAISALSCLTASIAVRSSG